MDCVDSATVTVHSAEGNWQPGNYELEFTNAGQAHNCRITLPGDAPTLPDAIAELPGTPAHVEVRLVRDGHELLHESRTLEYARFRPNGPGCEPTCRVATLELVVP